VSWSYWCGKPCSRHGFAPLEDHSADDDNLLAVHRAATLALAADERKVLPSAALPSSLSLSLSSNNNPSLGGDDNNMNNNDTFVNDPRAKLRITNLCKVFDKPLAIWSWCSSSSHDDTSNGSNTREAERTHQVASRGWFGRHTTKQQIVALDGVSLDVYEGECLAILGHNGIHQTPYIIAAAILPERLPIL
jgi:ABC-type glutathione transport system ATPase component